MVDQQNVRANQMAQDLAASSAIFNDVLLNGVDEDGNEHRLKINGNALIRSPNGQTLGRHGQNADHVFNVEQVSRMHLRLSVENDKLYVEDLGSFNGTKINGVEIAQGQPSALKHNDQLTIGTLVCTVLFL